MTKSESSITRFTVCTHTFIDMSKVRKNPRKFESLFEKHEKKCDLKSLMLESRSRPAFSTFISHKLEEIQIEGHKLLVFMDTQIRLSSLCVEVCIQLVPDSLLTFREGLTLIQKVKEVARQKLVRWEKQHEGFTPAILLEIPSNDFSAMDIKHVETELRKLLGFQKQNRFTHSISFSKLGEEDEKKALLVIAFREAEILREIWIIGPQLKSGQSPLNRARWWKLASLSCHAIEIAKKGYDKLLSEIADLEEQTETITTKFPKLREAEALTQFFQNLTELRKKLSAIDYRFATLQELVECIKKNMEFVNWGVHQYPSLAKPTPVSEKVVACSDRGILIPGFVIRELSGATWVDVPQTAQQMIDSPCRLFVMRSPTLGLGLVGQIKDVLNLTLREVEEEESRSRILIERLNSHVDEILRVAESETALLLQETQTKLAQRTEKVERSFKLLSIIFAAFSVGQVVSAFVIWYWGSVAMGQEIPLEYFLCALGVTVFVMLAAIALAVRAFFRTRKPVRVQ